MSIRLSFIILLTSLLSSLCWSDGYGYLTKIINKSPYSIKIQTTDQAGNIITTNGTTHTGKEGDHPIQNKQFSLSDISSLNLIIPWERWDGQARIYIDVWNGKNHIQRGELMERNNFIQLYTMNDWEPQPNQKPRQSILRTTNTNYMILINENGGISIPFELEINFSNDTAKPVQIGSPNCSAEANPSKQFTTYAPGQKGKELLLSVPGQNCKLQVTDAQTGRQATLCLDEKFNEIGCGNGPGCKEDPTTGINYCDNIGITWVLGLDPATQKILKWNHTNNAEKFYGLIKKIDYLQAAKEIFEGVNPDDGTNADSYWLTGNMFDQPATDFANAVWKFDSYWNKNPQFQGGFCDYIKTSDYAQNLLKNNPGDKAWVYKYKKMCNEPVTVDLQRWAQRGDLAEDGYFWNAPGYQVKCDGNATASPDKSGCVCKPGSGKNLERNPEAWTPAGVIKKHYRCP